MARRDRNQDEDRSAITDRARDERFHGDRNRGYDETVRRGRPLDVSVARGEYRPGRDELVGAGVRGYGEPGAYQQWGETDFDERGGAQRGGDWPRFDNELPRPRGPKGYKRTDERIREDLCEHLMDITDIDSSDVEVRVEGACIKLSGTVPERWMKHEIENIAATTLGVEDVQNEIRVPRSAD